MAQLNRRIKRQKVHRRIRKKVSGTAERPRLAVNFSNKHIHAQLIDDEAGVTIAAATTTQKGAAAGSNSETAAKIGSQIAEAAKAKKIGEVVFDRGGFIYHGKVKALAEAAREGGLKF